MMRRIKRGSFLAACLIGALLLQGSAATKVKTLKRIHDPVIMEGKELKPLLGSPIDRLALMAVNGGTWAPIPFQIDEKKPDGSFAFTMGPGASKDPDPNFDENDELVFMIKDTGDCAMGVKSPQGAKNVLEIEITDPKNGSKGWTYLIRFSGKTPRSKEDYIRLKIDEAGKYRMVVSYEYEMGGSTNTNFPDLMRALTKPDGSPGQDVADRVKTRGEVVLVGGIKIPFIMDEMTKSTDVGYIDGPVRILHLTQGYLEFTKHIKIKIKGHSLIAYYANHVFWPLNMDLPFNTLKVVKRVDFAGYFDFCPSIYGSYSFNAANPYNKGILFNGRMSAAEKNIDTKTEISWNAGFGPQGALINRLIFLPKGGIKLFTYFIDDQNYNDPPEDCPGVSAIGYNIVGIETQRGTIAALQYYYLLKKLKPEEIHLILDILDYPAEVKVKAIGSLN